MKTYYFLILFVFISVNIFSQSRKEQIATLTNQIDSIKQVVAKNEKEIKNKDSALKDKDSALKDLRISLINRDSSIVGLKTQLNKYESEIKTLNDNNALLTKNMEDLKNKQSSVAVEYSKLIQDIEQKNKQIISLNKRYEIFEINEFVKELYSSLELPDPDNAKSSIGDSTKFDLTKFNSLLDSNAVYSVRRIENLAGLMHKQYLIKLVKIESVSDENDHFIVVANVLYDIYDIGTFYNNELLIIIKSNGQFKLSRWSDVNMQKMVLSSKDGLQNFSEKDFYKTIGSLNK